MHSDLRRLRLAAVLDQEVRAGGGFQQALNDLIWLAEWASKNDADLRVHVFHRSSVEALARFGVQATFAPPGVLDYAFLALKYSQTFSLLQTALKWSAPLERRMTRAGVDMAYFPTQSKWHLAFDRLPYVITIFDNCHRDHPEFPEVRAFGEFERRERVYALGVTKACLVVVNDTELADKLSRRYGLDPERCVSLPFQPSPFVSGAAEDDSGDAEVLQRLGVPPGYLFYPAQFWAHKNHALLLEALHCLREQGRRAPRVVFAGGDRGAADAVRGLCTRLGVEATFLGFVESTDLAPLYRQSLALVMPSYFGPTNLPPLEAWALGTPVIYSTAFAAQAGDAALLFDPDEPRSLAEAIEAAQRPEVRRALIAAGRKRLAALAEQLNEGRRQFERRMAQLRRRVTALRS